MRIDAISDTEVTVLAIGLAGGVTTGQSSSGASFAGAGSGASNTVSNSTRAVLNGNVVNAPDLLAVTATDSAEVVADAAGVAFVFSRGPPGAVAIGASIAVNRIENTTLAEMVDPETINAGDVEIGADSDSEIDVLTLVVSATVGIAQENGNSFGLAGAGAGSGNKVLNTVTARVVDTIVDGITDTITGTLTVRAEDSSKIHADAGSVALALSLCQNGTCTNLTIGAAAATNGIATSTLAQIDPSTLVVGGDIVVEAVSKPTIEAFTFGLAGGVSNSSQGAGYSFAGAGSGSGNRIGDVDGRQHLTVAEVIDSTLTAGGQIRVVALDEAVIDADAGAVSITVAVSQSGSAVPVSVGAAVAINDIVKTVKAQVLRSTLVQATAVVVDATSATQSEALTIAGAGGVGVSGSGSSIGVAGAGAVSINDVAATVQALVEDSTITVSGTVTVTASEAGAQLGSLTGTDADDAADALDDLAVVEQDIVEYDDNGTPGDPADDFPFDPQPANTNESLFDIDGTNGRVADDTRRTTLQALFASQGISLSGNFTVFVLEYDLDIDDKESTPAFEEDDGDSETPEAPDRKNPKYDPFQDTDGFNPQIVRWLVRDGSGSTYIVERCDDGGGYLADLCIFRPALISADAGGVALTVNVGSSTALGISVGAAVAHNTVANNVSARVVDSTVDGAASFRVNAATSVTVDALAVGIAGGVSAGSGTSLAFSGAGAGTGNFITNVTTAEVLRVTADVNGTVDVVATDNSKIRADAGAGSFAVSGGSSGGISGAAGAGVTRSEIDNTVWAIIDDSDIGTALDPVQAVTVEAASTSVIDSIAATAVLAVGAGSGPGVGVSLAGSVSLAKITNTIEALVRNGSNIFTGSGHALTVRATDDSTISGDAGSGSLAVGAGSGPGVAVSGAGAIAINEIANIVRAGVLDSTLTIGGNLVVEALATSDINVVAVAISGAVGAGTAGIGVSGVGTVAINEIANTIEAGLWNAVVNVTSGVSAVTVQAQDASKITADGGGIAISVGAGTTGVGVAAGGTVADNRIGKVDIDDEDTDSLEVGTTDGPPVPLGPLDHIVRAIVLNTTIGSSVARANAVTTSASSTAVIDVLAVAGAAGVGAGSVGVGVAVAGVFSTNRSRALVQAFVDDSEIWTGVTDDVTVRATDDATINLDVGAGALGVGAGSVGVGVAGAGAVGINDIASQAIARVSDSTINTGGNLVVEAQSISNIDAVVVGVSVGVGAGSVGVGAAGAGSITINEIASLVLAEIVDSEIDVTGAHDLSILATDDSTIHVDSGGVGVGVGGGAVGVGIGFGLSYAENRITTSTTARLTRSIVDVGNDLFVTASSTATIDAVAIGGGVGVGVGYVGVAVSLGAAMAINRVNTTTIATIVDLDTDDGEHAIAGGDIEVTATTQDIINAEVKGVAVSIAGGFAGAAVSIGMSMAANDLAYVTNALVDGVDQLLAQTGHVFVEASSLSHIDPFAVAASFSVSIAIGGAVAAAGSVMINGPGEVIDRFIADHNESYANADDPTTSSGDSGQNGDTASDVEAKATNSTTEPGTSTVASIVNSNVTAGTAVAVTANDDAVIDATATSAALSAGLGGFGIAMTVNINVIDNYTAGYVEGSTVDAKNGDLEILANSTQTINNLAGSLSFTFAIGASVAGVFAGTLVLGVVEAFARQSTLEASGVVRIKATTVLTADTDADATAVAIGDSLALIGVVSRVLGRTSAFADGTVNITATGLEIAADGTHNAYADGDSVAVGFTSGVVLVYAKARVGRVTEAFIGTRVGQPRIATTLNFAGGDISVTSTSISTADALIYGAAASLGVSLNVLIGQATIEAATRAYIGEGPTVTARDVTIEAISTEDVDADATALAVGLIAGSGVLAHGEIIGATQAFIGTPAGQVPGANPTTTLNLTGAVDVSATTDAYATGTPSALGGGLLIALSLLKADIKVSSRTSAFVGEGVSLTSTGLTSRPTPPNSRPTPRCWPFRSAGLRVAPGSSPTPTSTASSRPTSAPARTAPATAAPRRSTSGSGTMLVDADALTEAKSHAEGVSASAAIAGRSCSPRRSSMGGCWPTSVTGSRSSRGRSPCGPATPTPPMRS